MSPDGATGLLDSLLPSALLGLAGIGVLVVAVVVQMALEGLWLDPARGALGTLARTLWVARRPGRDADVTTSFLAALCTLVPPTVAMTLVLRGDGLTPTMSDLVAVVLLAMTVPTPILFALAAGPEGRRRLALDDALARSARRGLYILSLACVAGTWAVGPVALAVAMGLVRQRLRQHGSLKPSSDAGLQHGARLALTLGRQALVVVVLVLGLRALWPLTKDLLDVSGPGWGFLYAVVCGTAAVVGVVRGVAFVGPLRAEGLGPRGPLVLLVAAVVLTLGIRLAPLLN